MANFESASLWHVRLCVGIRNKTNHKPSPILPSADPTSRPQLSTFAYAGSLRVNAALSARA